MLKQSTASPGTGVSNRLAIQPKTEISLFTHSLRVQTGSTSTLWCKKVVIMAHYYSTVQSINISLTTSVENSHSGLVKCNTTPPPNTSLILIPIRRSGYSLFTIQRLLSNTELNRITNWERELFRQSKDLTSEL